MASCTDLSPRSTTNDYRSIMKTNPIPLLTSRKFVEPFTRLKNRANLFRRKNYSSQTDISNPRSSLPADHFIPTHELPPTEHPLIALKRSNSMICPQEHLQTLIKSTHPPQRNSICVRLSDDHRFLKSSSNRYWNKKMSNIHEQETFPSDESLDEEKESPEKNVMKDDPMASDLTSSKTSTCTMTGKSLNNLDECLSSTSSEDKGVQTTFNESIATNCSSSLSSSSTSIQTDSLENKPKISTHACQLESDDKWPHLLREEQTCIYWVNYLGSTAIEISNESTSILPIDAIQRLKQSTRYARVLPIIGLSISSRGVEFLKHTTDRIVICFHDIKSIHSACQDQDLRYFAYVTREQRITNRIIDTMLQPPLSFSSSDSCHVFVVKNPSMSTEILLNFGQAFDMAYRVHHRFNDKANYVDQSHSKLDANHRSKKSKQMIVSSTHSPEILSSPLIDEQRVFV